MIGWKSGRLNWSKLSSKASRTLKESSEKNKNMLASSLSTVFDKGKKIGSDGLEQLSQHVSDKFNEQLDSHHAKRDAKIKQRHADHLSIAKESLEYLLDDKRLPDDVKETLKEDFLQVKKMLEKLEHEYIHIAVLGRVSVGKSSLLNALLSSGDQDVNPATFSVSPLHGETKTTAYSDWKAYQSGFVSLIDTPGINEVNGENRETIAMDVVSRSDIILFVVDGDMTQTEYNALETLSKGVQPIIIVLNKADQYTRSERELLIEKLQERTERFVKHENIISSWSKATQKIIIYVDEQGNETETKKIMPVDVLALKHLLLDLLEKEGKSLAALNATFFAGKLADNISERLIESQYAISTQVIKMYCVSKGLAVAVNPIPVVDLFSAALIDVSMIVHLSRVYGLDMSKAESAKLIRTIMSQLILLMGSIWLMYIVSSALKATSFGFSTMLTATGEGVVAYYGTYVVGKAANVYFKQGKSWGDLGPRRAVKKILDSIDRDSVMQQAKDDILIRMKQ